MRTDPLPLTFFIPYFSVGDFLYGSAQPHSTQRPCETAASSWVKRRFVFVMNRTEQIRSHAGPSLLALAIVHTLLVAASIIAGALLKHGATVVNP